MNLLADGGPVAERSNAPDSLGLRSRRRIAPQNRRLRFPQLCKKSPRKPLTFLYLYGKLPLVL
jgi:hypothetical protein